MANNTTMKPMIDYAKIIRDMDNPPVPQIVNQIVPEREYREDPDNYGSCIVYNSYPAQIEYGTDRNGNIFVESLPE